ncbi:MAG: ribosome biogenesis GTPase Der [Proteobacteria bacterium]|nr:ribosome biogenesis GTPase Der [Pseudomonadota bacterium]
MNTIKPIVAIIGRPNVGKSTLFNAITRRRKAIVDAIPGVTRDRNYMDVERDGKSFLLVDTGGFDTGSDSEMARMIREQAQMAIEEADAILFLMDGREGLHHTDIEITRMLQKINKPVFYTINKVESAELELNSTEFYQLGVEPLYTISAKNRVGINDLMDEVAGSLPDIPVKKDEGEETVVSVIGRPNVGKSSFVNRILGYERLLVSDQPGTTRDSIDTVFKYKHKTIRIIDTAGIRRKSRVSLRVEKYCIMEALRSISHSSVCLLLIDASQGVTDQDQKLAAEIYEMGRACILVINKWDLIEKDNKTYDNYMSEVYSQLPFLDFAPALCVSALTGLRVRKVLDLIEEVEGIYEQKVSTSEFNKLLKTAAARNPLPRLGRGSVKIYYGTQDGTSPPSFVLFTNAPQDVPKNYKRFLEREIRERFGFAGTPIRLFFKEKPKRVKK